MHGKILTIYCGANKADFKGNLSIYYLKASYISPNKGKVVVGLNCERINTGSHF